MNRRLAVLSAAVVGAVFSLRPSYAGIVADSVVSYTPGNLASNESIYNNPAAALGPLNGDTGYGYALNPFTPPYDPSQIVIVQAGGQITLHLSEPVTTTGGRSLGVFSNNGLIDGTSDYSGVATNPADTFDDPNYPEAIVSVSKDGTHFVQLNGGNPILFTNPTNYYLDTPITPEAYDYQSLGSVVANQYQPFNGTLASFNGETYAQMKTMLNGSAGGTWLDLSGTGLSSVNYVQFSAPSDGGYRFVLDGVSGSQAAGPQLTWLGGSTWDTTSSNWQNGGTGTATFSNVSNTTSGDNVLFDDSATSSNLTISGTVLPTTITFNNDSHKYTLTGANSSSGIAGPGSLTVNGTGSVVLTSNNTYTGGTWVNSGQLILATVAAYPANTALYILPAGTVKLNPGVGAIVLGSLNNTGLIDLTNNSLIVHNGDIAAITAQVAAAYDNGAWDGTSNAGAITSSTAANDPKHLTAVGVATSGTDVLIKYTYYGDATLDGSVSSADYTLIDNGYLSNLTGWQNGDFNYDGVINGSDYTLIDNAFNQQGAAISGEIAVSTAQPAGSTSVPEPAAILWLPTIALIGRRRRKAR